MRALLILLVHLITTTARLMGPGGARSVIAESLLVKHQLLILNRSRQRAPNLRASDRLLAGVCSLFIRPTRVVRSAIVLKPSTILDFHRHLRTRKYRVLCSPTGRGRPCASRIPNSLHDRDAVWPGGVRAVIAEHLLLQAATARLAPSSPAGATPDSE